MNRNPGSDLTASRGEHESTSYNAWSMRGIGGGMGGISPQQNQTLSSAFAGSSDCIGQVRSVDGCQYCDNVTFGPRSRCLCLTHGTEILSHECDTEAAPRAYVLEFRHAYTATDLDS